MLREKYLAWGYTRNCMRELSAYGNARKLEIGEENVYDYGLGNPNVPAPACVEEAISTLNAENLLETHARTPLAGLPEVRRTVAEDLNRRYHLGVRPELVFMTCAATAGLAMCCNALLSPGDEAIFFAPYFTEYRVFVEGARGVPVPVPPDERMLPDLDAFADAITERTKFVLVNSPNNPSGVALDSETLTQISDILQAAQNQYGHPIYLISDEPYREIVYGNEPIPEPMNYYDNTILCYSLSKALSLPGERIGYVVVSSRATDAMEIYDALAGAALRLGYRNAPAMMQRVLAKCAGQTSDISIYRRNRDLLYAGLTELGFSCIEPDGAFYLFVKSPEPDAKACSERAKKYELLLVPSDDFGLTGYLRLAYCVSTEMIERSMPAFRLLAEEYGLI